MPGHMTNVLYMGSKISALIAQQIVYIDFKVGLGKVQITNGTLPSPISKAATTGRQGQPIFRQTAQLAFKFKVG